MTVETLRDLERKFKNAAARWRRAGNRDKQAAYDYAAYLTRQAIRQQESDQ